MDIQAIEQIASIVNGITRLGMMGVAVYYLHNQAVFWRDRYLERVSQDDRDKLVGVNWHPKSHEIYLYLLADKGKAMHSPVFRRLRVHD